LFIAARGRERRGKPCRLDLNGNVPRPHRGPAGPHQQLERLGRIGGGDVTCRVEESRQPLERPASAHLRQADHGPEFGGRSGLLDQDESTVRQRNGAPVRARDARAPRGRRQPATTSVIVSGEVSGAFERSCRGHVSGPGLRSLCRLFQRSDDILVGLERGRGQVPSATVGLLLIALQRGCQRRVDSAPAS
jgi:hypothetical protein